MEPVVEVRNVTFGYGGAPVLEMPPQAELLAALDSAFDVPATGRGAALTTTTAPQGRAGSMRRATVPPPMFGEPVGPLAVLAVESPAAAPEPTPDHPTAEPMPDAIN